MAKQPAEDRINPGPAENQNRQRAAKLRPSGVATCIVLACWIALSTASLAQTPFHNLINFDGMDGREPLEMSLIQGTDGNFYGTTALGGANDCFNVGCGTIFKISSTGELTTLYSFCAKSNCADGGYPTAGLVQGADGNFYGTTTGGGNADAGTVFKITATGTLTILHRFCLKSDCADGESPTGPLVQGTDGSFYGTTELGGLYDAGTVFKISPGGKLRTLHSFCAKTNCPDGDAPFAGLVQATDGNLYGTTIYGGHYGRGSGTVFRITAAGRLTTLYSFCTKSNCSDGANPYAGLIQASDGNFYGTTVGVIGTVPSTIFEITPVGKLTTLSIGSDIGYAFYAGLIQATDRNFYGTATAGGGYGCGTIFRIAPDGTTSLLLSFDCHVGESPYGGLLQATDGSFYGTTGEPNFGGDGTVFSLSVGLGAFVATRPISAEIGTRVVILGTELAGASSVTFNGKAAKFKVRSSSEIITRVPKGATTGKVRVKTPRGALISNVIFRVER